jgi:UDP-N-acetylmuramoylalanine--D-glutamate ligase
MHLKMIGQHNYHNALAVMAIIQLLNVNQALALKAVEAFPGLEHRCEFVLEKNQVSWWNDSKGTNVASTITAINSLIEMVPGKLMVILGGQGKGQDFSELVDRLKGKARAVILLGECKKELEKLFVGATDVSPYSNKIIVVETLEQAVQTAKQHAQEGDAVLLSPACASLDMFKNYEDRGRQFKSIVKRMILDE